MYEIVSFEESQASALARLINSVYFYDSVTTWSLIRVTKLDPNFDPSLSLVAIENNEPIACIIGAIRNKAPVELINAEHAWIKIFAFKPEHVKSGLADRLLSQLEDELRERGFKDIRATDFSGWLLFPGINTRSEEILKFLMSRGYGKVSEATSYIINLDGFSVPSTVLEEEESQRSEGIEYRIPNKDEKDKVASWVLENYGPISSFETILSFRHENPGVILAERGNEILGAVLFSALENNWLGPVLVSEDKKEISDVLLHKALWEMKLRGFDRVLIPSASSSPSYSRLPGIVGIKHYWILSKNL